MLVAAAGVVYGDIGTSPLYTIKEVFSGQYGVQVNHDGVFGILALIFWSLVWVVRSEEHTSELQSLMRISYAVFCLKKKTHLTHNVKAESYTAYTHHVTSNLLHDNHGKHEQMHHQD